MCSAKIDLVLICNRLIKNWSATMDDYSERNQTRTYNLYSKRWWILLCVAATTTISRIVRGCFGIVNDVYVAYFNISYETVDWFALIQVPGSLLSSLLLGLMLFYKLVSIRKLAISTGLCLVLEFIALLAAYIYTPLYPLIFIGQFLLGFVIVAIDVLSTSLAVSWFPENQMGIAISTKEAGSSIGSLLAFVIPSNLLISPSYNQVANQSDPTYYNTRHPSTDHEWFARNQLRFILFASALLFVAVLTTIFYCIFFEDKPPTPPTAAQEQAMFQSNQFGQPSFTFNNLKQFFVLCKKIVFNKLFVQAIIILSTAVGCNVVIKIYMGEVLRWLYLDLGYLETADVMAGYNLVLLQVGSILGDLLSGVVVNHIKNYQLIIVFDLVLYLISTISFSLGYHFHNIVVLYVFGALIGFHLSFLTTPIYESIFQHLYPIDTGLLAVVIRIEYSSSNLILGVLGRKTFNIFHRYIAVLGFMCILVFMALIVSLFFKPQYNRLQVGAHEEKDRNLLAVESQELLSTSN